MIFFSINKEQYFLWRYQIIWLFEFSTTLIYRIIHIIPNLTQIYQLFSTRVPIFLTYITYIYTACRRQVYLSEGYWILISKIGLFWINMAICNMPMCYPFTYVILHKYICAQIHCAMPSNYNFYACHEISTRRYDATYIDAILLLHYLPETS